MNEDGNYQKELERAEEAKRLLAAPIFAEACNRIDAELRVLREGVPISDSDMHTRLILMEQLWGKLLDHLRAVMESGDYARAQLKLRESFTERAVNAIRQGIRI
jgi:hypothetical protein